MTATPAKTSDADARLHIRRRLSRAGWLFCAILAFLLGSAMMSGINHLVLLFGLLAGCVWINWVAAKRNLRGLSARRRLPEHVFAGDPLTVEVEIANRRRFSRATALCAEDRIQASAEAVACAVFFASVAPRATGRAAYRALLARRGRYRFGPMMLGSGYPFGLVRARARWPAADSLIVYPRLGKLTPQWEREWRKPTDQGARSLPQRSLTGEDYHGLRDYRAGDNIRWIHWRTSARKGRLMVREFERRRRQDLVLLVDLWVPPGAEAAALDAVELGVRFAATLCVEACRAGAGRIVLGIAGRERRTINGAGGPHLMHALLEALACAEASPRNDPYALLGEVSRYCHAESRLVVVGPRPLMLRQPVPSASAGAGNYGAGTTAPVGTRDDKPAMAPAAGRAVRVNTRDAEFFTYFQDDR